MWTERGKPMAKALKTGDGPSRRQDLNVEKLWGPQNLEVD
jgi:hypothetical protein